MAGLEEEEPFTLRAYIQTLTRISKPQFEEEGSKIEDWVRGRSENYLRTNFTILDPSRLFQRGISCCESGNPRRLNMATVIDDENGDLLIPLLC